MSVSSSLARRSASHADNTGSNPVTDATRTCARLGGTELSATNRNEKVRLFSGALSFPLVLPDAGTAIRRPMR